MVPIGRLVPAPLSAYLAQARTASPSIGSVGPSFYFLPGSFLVSFLFSQYACVEMDVLKPRNNRIWIGMGDEGAWQEVIYVKVPSFCTTCKKIGHDSSSCTRNSKPRKAATLAP